VRKEGYSFFQRSIMRHIGRHIGSDDFASFQMEMDGGALVNVVLDTHLIGYSQEVVLVGTEGHLVARGGSLYGRRNEDGGKEEKPLYVDEDDEGEDEIDQQAGGEWDPLAAGIHLRGVALTFRHLAERLRASPPASEEKEGDSPLATFESAHYVQSVLEALRSSSASRSWTQVTTLTDLEKNQRQDMSLLRLRRQMLKQ